MMWIFLYGALGGLALVIVIVAASIFGGLCMTKMLVDSALEKGYIEIKGVKYRREE